MVALRDFIIYTSLIGFVLYITYLNNMWGVSKGTKKAKQDIRIAKTNALKRRRMVRYMSYLRTIDSYIGFSLSPMREKEYQQQISRLRIVIKILDRNIEPSELNGLFKVIRLSGVFLTVLFYIMSSSLIVFAPLILLFTPQFFNIYAVSKIADEDAQIERDFPDLFGILYTRLLKGSKQRLSPTLQEFLNSLDASGNRFDNPKAIKQFVVDFRNNIEIYADESMALMQLREKYNSVMIINFCNLAVQSLRGVDNSDKLLAFKIDLNSKRMEQMQTRADKLVAKGSRAIWVAFLILGQFIALSWYAKLMQAGGLGSLFGM